MIAYTILSLLMSMDILIIQNCNEIDLTDKNLEYCINQYKTDSNTIFIYQWYSHDKINFLAAHSANSNESFTIDEYYINSELDTVFVNKDKVINVEKQIKKFENLNLLVLHSKDNMFQQDVHIYYESPSGTMKLSIQDFNTENALRESDFYFLFEEIFLFKSEVVEKLE